MRMTGNALRYQGSKYTVAEWIIGHMPEHGVYVEEYGGSGAVLLNKSPAGVEVYNDLDVGLHTLFKVLRDKTMSVELAEAIENTPWGRLEYYESEVRPEDGEVEVARKVVARSFMGLSSGSLNRGIGGFNSRIDYRKNNRARCPTMEAFRKYPMLIRALRERLANVILECREAEEVMDIYDSDQTLHYIDPPYVLTEWNKRDRGCYRRVYTEEEHESMLKHLLKLEGYVIVSGYETDLYNDILMGWHKDVKITRNQLAQDREEVIWINPRAWEANTRRQASLLP